MQKHVNCVTFVLSLCDAISNAIGACRWCYLHVIVWSILKHCILTPCVCVCVSKVSCYWCALFPSLSLSLSDLLETRSLPIEIMAMERVVKYMLNVQKVHYINFQDSHEKQAKSSKRHKENFVFPLNTRYGNMVWKMERNILASWGINRFLYEWGVFPTSIRRLMFINYTIYVVHKLKTMFFADGEITHINTCSTTQTITCIYLISHSLRCEIGCWGTSDESNNFAQTSSRI